MRITENIKEALRKAIDSCDSQRDFAQKRGIPHESICRYLSGKTKKMEQDTWTKLEPVLRPYLKDASPANFSNSRPVLSHLEAELVDKFRELPYERQLAVLKFVAEMRVAADKSQDGVAAGLEVAAG